jgi:outer membrane receptor protein involved in Fe transport
MRRPAKSHRALLIAAGVATTCGSAAVLAEEGASKRRIEEVIVTAERREASIQDTSISITAFDSEFLDDFGIRNQEDLQNFIPATTIQPYDATVRGVGRNFRALGGDPGVATYVNGVYAEDLLTATAATFWDVERIEVLRGPQGTLYGRNAVGGAINIIYKEPTDEFEASAKSVLGDYGTQEFYGAVSGPIIKGKLAGRLNYSSRDRDGIVDELGTGDDIDGLGTQNLALQLRWNPTETLEFQVRQNILDSDRSFGGADGGGLIVLNEEGAASRNTTDLVPGFREIDPNQTTNPLASDFFDASRATLSFTDPQTGRVLQAQHARPGIDFVDADGFQNAAASMTGFNQTSDADAAELNGCAFGGSIDGDDLCAGTNGQNREEFRQRGTQFSASWDVNERLELKYIYGYSTLMYERTTDDDNTHSQFHDRQFYVNHEATYYSHELQAFYDFTDDISVTSGIFFYDAVIDQRGDFYSTLEERRYIDPYVDNTALSAGAAAAIGAPALTGISATNLAFAGAPMPTLFSAKQACQVNDPAPSCARNFAVENPNSEILPDNRNDNLVTGLWQGDQGTDPDLDVDHGPNTLGSDLLYATKTERDAFAFYTQGVWDIDADFSLTLGVRYAEDEVKAEENLYRYSETGGAPGDFLDLYGGLAVVNLVNGGLIDNGDGTFSATRKATNGGVPFGLSVYRPFERTDKKWTGRANLDWNINPTDMMYFSVTSGYRSGGYNLVFFSETATYDPEELVAYEVGYKTRWLDETLQVNGSFYYYDYETIHTTAAEVAAIGGNTISVVEAPGAEIMGAEGEIIWFPTDNLTLGGNFSYTPSEYTEDKFIADPSRVETPSSLFPNNITAQTENINGNQVLQVPEVKYTAYASYMVPLEQYGSLEFFTAYSYTDEVYYSPFERDEEKADEYDRTDIRASWYSPDESWTVTAFVNNVFDEVGVRQVLREDEAEFFRHTAGITSPRLWGFEVSWQTGNY